MYHVFDVLGADFLDKCQEFITTIQQFFLSLGAIGRIILVLLIVYVGKFVAKFIGNSAEKALNKTDFDDKVAKRLGYESNVSKAVGGFVFAFCMLFVLIFALGAAEFRDVSGALTDTFESIFGFVVRLALAGVFAYVVIAIAKIIKSLLTDVLKAAKLDERLGAATGATPISDAIVMAVYCFFILFFTPAILDVLELEAVSQPISDIVNQIIAVVPGIIGAGLLIFIGVMIANIAKELVVNLLKATNVDNLPAKIGLNIPTSGPKSVSGVTGTVVMISIAVLIITAAIQLIGVPMLTGAAEVFSIGYFSLLLALIILGIGLLGAKYAYQNLADKNLTLAKAVRAGIVILTVVIALDRSGLAPELTGLPYEVAIYALGVALGVGGAIAIGLGARDFVSRWLSKREN